MIVEFSGVQWAIRVLIVRARRQAAMRKSQREQPGFSGGLQESP
jgi:hypothetical protein